MPIPGHPHDVGVARTEAVVRSAFGLSFWLRIQMALNLSLWTDPVPDLAVVLGTFDDYADTPTTALLVVEVSDS